MALSIKHPEADRLARELAQWTGEGLTETVVQALRERLVRLRGHAAKPMVSEKLRDLRRHCAAIPVVDARSPDEILGYDEQGLPGRW